MISESNLSYSVGVNTNNMFNKISNIWNRQSLRTVFLIGEILWTAIKTLFHILKAVFLMIVPTAPKDVCGEIVLITGAGHGIGRELALQFSDLGAVVVCVDINPAGNKVTKDLITHKKRTCYTYECDIRKRDDVMRLAEKICKEVGDVSILVNNAGVMPVKQLVEHTEQDIKFTYEVNVFGTLWMIQAFLPSMVEKNHGHIATISSMAGLMGTSNMVPYTGSKYALRGIMEGIYVELHEGNKRTDKIKLTTICPYMVDTGLCKNPQIRFKSLLAMLKPADVAAAAIDAIRRDYLEVTVPSCYYYLFKYYYRVIPFAASQVLNDFLQTGAGPQD